MTTSSRRWGWAWLVLNTASMAWNLYAGNTAWSTLGAFVSGALLGALLFTEVESNG